ncbi:MAG: hypothetical protein K8S94_09600 [Planctomycetia bacterium]|nr:hypothetical protein [Planctomycetia bacterium]
MIRKLRNLLVALAALATILAGVRSPFAESLSLETAVSSTDDRTYDGSREDDSGTRSEQVEEDDSEEQDGREVHLFATSALSCSLDACVAGVTRPVVYAAPQARGRSALVRGPPAAF